MATMGVRINQGLGSESSTKLAQILADALFGNADTAREDALARSRLETDVWQRKVMGAQAANQQAVADTANWALRRQEEALDPTQDYFEGLVPELAPVEVQGPPELAVAPVEVQTTPSPVTSQEMGQRPFLTGTMRLSQDELPAPVEMDPLLYDTPAPTLQQPTAEQQAARDREVAFQRAKAGAILGGGGTANQVAEGLGIGEGSLLLKSPDPDIQRQGNTLYTGKAEDVAGKGGVPNTEGAGNARLYAGMMLDSELMLRDATPESVPDLWTTLAGLPDENITMDMIKNLAVGADDKRYLSAAYRWTLAQLRKTTGATINKSELSGTLQAYIPLAGDNAQGIVEKARARRVFERGLVEQGYGYESEAYKSKVAEFKQLYGIDLLDAGTTDTAPPDAPAEPEPAPPTEEEINAKIQAALPDVITRDQARRLLLQERR